MKALGPCKNVDSYWHKDTTSHAVRLETSQVKLFLQRHEDIWWSGDMASLILSLCTRWKWVVSITPRLPYSRKKCIPLRPTAPPPQVPIKCQILYAGLRNHWLRGLKRGSAAARLLELRVRILPEGTNVSLLWFLCVLYGRGPCDRPITRPEESHRLWRVSVWWWSLDNEVLIH
jgi:hypothetical protein